MSKTVEELEKELTLVTRKLEGLKILKDRDIEGHHKWVCETMQDNLESRQNVLKGEINTKRWKCATRRSTDWRSG